MGGGGGRAPLIHNIGTWWGWAVRFTSRSLYPLKLGGPLNLHSCKKMIFRPFIVQGQNFVNLRALWLKSSTSFDSFERSWPNRGHVATLVNSGHNLNAQFCVSFMLIIFTLTLITEIRTFRDDGKFCFVACCKCSAWCVERLQDTFLVNDNETHRSYTQ